MRGDTNKKIAGGSLRRARETRGLVYPGAAVASPQIEARRYAYGNERKCPMTYSMRPWRRRV